MFIPYFVSIHAVLWTTQHGINFEVILAAELCYRLQKLCIIWARCAFSKAAAALMHLQFMQQTLMAYLYPVRDMSMTSDKFQFN